MRKIALLLFILAVVSFGLFFVSRNNQEYTITFDSNGGSSVATQKVKYHQKATKPTDPTRENYDFQGWQYNGVSYNFNQNVEENIHLTALWQEKKSYLVTISLGSEKYESRFYENSLMDMTKYTLPPKEGYHIVLYNNSQVFDLTTPVTADLNLVAQYEKNS